MFLYIYVYIYTHHIYPYICIKSKHRVVSLIALRLHNKNSVLSAGAKDTLA